LLVSLHFTPDPLYPEQHFLKPIITVIPAKAGIQKAHNEDYSWIPAFARMTETTLRKRQPTLTSLNMTFQFATTLILSEINRYHKSMT
jgi:hypothetical protein